MHDALQNVSDDGDNTFLKTAEFDALVCLSHLRWNFVYQRPQHLMSRFAKHTKLFFFEEPIIGDGPTHIEVNESDDGVFVAVPHISPEDEQRLGIIELQRHLLDEVIENRISGRYALWFYTPMAMEFADHLDPAVTIYDCMDELSAFKFAPPELLENERRLLEKADLVFTGGRSLYEAKRDRHPQVFAFPSSIDVKHFQKARNAAKEPEDQANISGPKLGYCGVIDERIDLDLIAGIADLRPEWQFVMIGPVVKISEDDLPRRDNIHYIGGRDYMQLPDYMSGWDVALMPFAINESTKFISPTKTPEYLAAGKPVISTAIRDVVHPYADERLVRIANTAEQFVAAADEILADSDRGEWLSRADEFLSNGSWDATFGEMLDLIKKEASREETFSVQTA